jgi:Rap1a immunity proteins
MACAAALSAVALSIPVEAQEAGTGNSVFNACKLATRDNSPRNTNDMLLLGICFGNVDATFYHLANQSFCPPDGVTNVQGVRVLVRYMESNPQEHHLKIAELAERAFKWAWPCKR